MIATAAAQALKYEEPTPARCARGRVRQHGGAAWSRADGKLYWKTKRGEDRDGELGGGNPAQTMNIQATLMF